MNYYIAGTIHRENFWQRQAATLHWVCRFNF